MRTTAKTARAQAGQATRNDPRPVVVPVEKDVARFAFMRDVPVATAGAGTPASARAAVHSAPQVVYTQGFAADAPAPADRFSGSAVTFLSVAKFATN